MKGVRRMGDCVLIGDSSMEREREKKGKGIFMMDVWGG